MLHWIGWIARPSLKAPSLQAATQSRKRLQALGASCWLVYGVLIHSAPMVASNIIVAGVAVYSSLRRGPGVELSEAA